MRRPLCGRTARGGGALQALRLMLGGGGRCWRCDVSISISSRASHPLMRASELMPGPKGCCCADANYQFRGRTLAEALSSQICQWRYRVRVRALSCVRARACASASVGPCCPLSLFTPPRPPSAPPLRRRVRLPGWLAGARRSAYLTAAQVEFGPQEPGLMPYAARGGGGAYFGAPRPTSLCQKYSCSCRNEARPPRTRPIVRAVLK